MRTFAQWTPWQQQIAPPRLAAKWVLAATAAPVGRSGRFAMMTPGCLRPLRRHNVCQISRSCWLLTAKRKRCCGNFLYWEWPAYSILQCSVAQRAGLSSPVADKTRPFLEDTPNCGMLGLWSHAATPRFFRGPGWFSVPLVCGLRHEWFIVASWSPGIFFPVTFPPEMICPGSAKMISLPRTPLTLRASTGTTRPLRGGRFRFLGGTSLILVPRFTMICVRVSPWKIEGLISLNHPEMGSRPM